MLSALLLLVLSPFFPAQEDDSVLRALVDELERSKTLKLDDMDVPYYIQYSVNDVETWQAEFSFGGLSSSSMDHSCSLTTDVRVGSWDLDNSNSGGGFGGFGGRGWRGGGRGGGGSVSLPEDHDYAAIRHAVWLASDSAYKRAIEGYAEKMASLDESRNEDRPADFTPSEPIVKVLPLATLSFTDSDWQVSLEKGAQLTNLMNGYPQVVDGGFRISARATNHYIVSSEGTQIRHGNVQYTMNLSVTVETPEGLRLSDSQLWLSSSPASFGSPLLRSRLVSLVESLTTTSEAPLLEGYTGPVLFDDIAAAQLFQALLARGIAAQPGQSGGGRRRFSGGENLERMVGKRLLPTPFAMWDDPTASEYRGIPLAGHYLFDSEGIAPEKVELIKDGKLEAMLMARTPTAKFSGSTGHGRSGRSGSIRATIGNLFVAHSNGLSAEELTEALRATAEMSGLEYGLRISALTPGMASMMSGGNMRDMRSFFQRQRGGRGGSPSPLGDPLYVFKVYVEDGHEEPVRGLEFDAISVSSLRDILFAGSEQVVWNQGGTSSSSIIAPAVLFEELDLYAIEDDSGAESNLPAPHARNQ